MSRPPTRRKCLYCNRFFFPDRRTANRQRFCSEPACRKAGKAASQQRWLSKNGNGDYFRGPDQVARVRQWRQRHPGYWKPKKRMSESIQPVDIQLAKPVQSSCNAPPDVPGALQDHCLAQDPAFVGLVSMITGSALQEDIAATTRQLLIRGRNILGPSGPQFTPPVLDL